MRTSVMIVDDLKDHRTLLRKSLLGSGCRARIYLSKGGREAIKKQRLYKPKLILLDMHMPGIDGPEVLREIRSFDKNVEVIAISGYDKQLYEPRMKGLGLKCWINKPVIQEHIEAIAADINGLEKDEEEPRLLKKMENDLDFIEKKLKKEDTIGIDERLRLLLARTSLVLLKYPRICSILESIFAKEIPELNEIVADLKTIDIDEIAKGYATGIARIRELERKILKKR